MNLNEALQATSQPEPVERTKPAVPKMGEPGTWEWDGNVGVINTQPTLERVTNWDAYIIYAGLDPEAVEVIEPVNIRGWDSNAGKTVGADGVETTNIIKMHYYSLRVRTRRPGPVIDDLLAIARKIKAPKKSVPTGDSTYVVALGDLQYGKMDGDGVEGTQKRVIDGLERAAERLSGIRKYDAAIERVAILWLGDCIEGFVSQGGASAWRTTLTLTEQIRLLRETMLASVDLFAPLTQDLVEAAVGGNHDEAVRFNGKGITRYDDSFDIDSLSAVEMAVKRGPNSDHIKFYTPAADELTLTFETSGTILGMSHGHKARMGKHFDWWQRQSFGDQPIGQADILLSGHYHTYFTQEEGKRMFIQVPALESESTWVRHSKGVTGNPGVLTFVTKDKRVSNLTVL